MMMEDDQAVFIEGDLKSFVDRELKPGITHSKVKMSR